MRIFPLKFGLIASFFNRHKEMMLEAEKLDKWYKEERKAEEQRMEQEFRKKMMEKFAVEQKLEQLTLQKRRQKELDFKKEVVIN